MKIVRTVNHGLTRWRVSYYAGGKQIRKFFDSEALAKVHASSVKEDAKRSGDGWLSITNADRLDCVAALEISHKHGFTLTDAARMMSMQHSRIEEAPSVTKAIESCMIRKRTLNLRPRSLRNLEHTLERFGKSFRSRLISSLKPKEIEDWLLGLEVAPATRKGHQTNVHTLFSHAISMDWVLRNPVAKIPQPVIDDKPPGIITVEQCKDLMRSCVKHHPEMVPFFVLCLFLGIRPQEVLKLRPDAVDVKRGIVTVDVGSSKTRRRRIVTIPKNAKAWLTKFKPLTVKNWQAKFWKVREAAGLRAGWPHDAMRHSFASYFYAFHKDAAKAAAEMGNSPEVFFRHYREIVTREEAQKFFAIGPAQ